MVGALSSGESPLPLPTPCNGGGGGGGQNEDKDQGREKCQVVLLLIPLVLHSEMGGGGALVPGVRGALACVLALLFSPAQGHVSLMWPPGQPDS